MRTISYLLVIIFSELSLPSYASFPDCPEAIRNSYECAKYLEKKLGKETPGLFTRKNGLLEIRLANGKLKIYADDKQSVTGETHFNIIQYFPSVSFAVIHTQYWEGNTYYVLNLHSGTETHVKGYPVVSPDKRRIAIHAFDILANYGPNILAIYLIKNDNLELEFIAEPTDWGPTNVHWVNSQRLSFAKTWYDPNGNEKTELKTVRYQPNTMVLEYRWIIE